MADAFPVPRGTVAQEQSEEEFLASYDASRWPHPSLTADMAVFRRGHDGSLELLLVQRGNHPYRGCWALPGGFAEPGETIEQTAQRELAEEAGLVDVSLEPFGFYSQPGRDPRDWTTTRAFVALVDEDAHAQAGDDAAAAAWFAIEHAVDSGRHMLRLTGPAILWTSFDEYTLPLTGTVRAQVHAHEGFAFDHYCIVADAWLALRAKLCQASQDVDSGIAGDAV